MYNRGQYGSSNSAQVAMQTAVTYKDYKKIIGFEDVGYFLQNYIESGGEVTVNMTRNDTIDVASIVAVLQNDVTSRDGTVFQAKYPNATYYLDFVDGDFWWETFHPVGVAATDYLTIAVVTTDGNRNINVITDARGDVGGFKLKDTIDFRSPYYDAQLADMMYNVKTFGAVGDGVTDDAIAIQEAIDATAAAGGGVVWVPRGQYLVTSPIVIWSRVILSGAGRDASEIIKSVNSTYTGASGVSADAVLYMDYADSTLNFRSKISDIGITGGAGVGGIYMGNATQATLTDINIVSGSYGVSARSIWMCRFDQIRARCQGIMFDFSAFFDKTSLSFYNCWAEACQGFINLQAATYCSFVACGNDYSNYGGHPDDPYGGAGGDYQTLAYVIYLAGCQGITFVSFGTENSCASWLYCEGAFVTFTGSYLFGLRNYVTPTGSQTAGFIVVKGVGESAVRIQTSRFASMVNYVSPSIGIRGIYTESPTRQKILLDDLITFDSSWDLGNDNITYSKNAIHYAIQRPLIQDGVFASNIPVEQLPLYLYNAGAYTDGTAAYVTNSSTRKKSVLISTDGTDAPNPDTIVDHNWIWPFDPAVIRGKTVRLVLRGAQTAGGSIAAVGLDMMHADELGVGETVIYNIPLARLTENVVDYYIPIPTSAKAMIYFRFGLQYKALALRIDEFRVDVIDDVAFGV